MRIPTSQLEQIGLSGFLEPVRHGPPAGPVVHLPPYTHYNVSQQQHTFNPTIRPSSTYAIRDQRPIVPFDINHIPDWSRSAMMQYKAGTMRIMPRPLTNSSVVVATPGTHPSGEVDATDVSVSPEGTGGGPSPASNAPPASVVASAATPAASVPTTNASGAAAGGVGSIFDSINKVLPFPAVPVPAWVPSAVYAGGLGLIWYAFFRKKGGGGTST